MNEAVREAFVERVFCDAAAIEDPEARRGFLEQICNGDHALRTRVEALLDASDRARDFLRTAEVATPDSATPFRLRPGDTVGRYALTEVLSQGVYADVFTARQTIPDAPRIALKVITAGMGSPSIRARFDAERKTLSRMSHPNIAQVFDADTTDDGHPYIAMEFVDGAPITTYADQRRLSVAERLALFSDVCAAVAHAHQKAVIHRDLKPGNILVAEVDGRHIVKVIDFGIAKVIAPEFGHDPALTADGTYLGTPLYMSPEQAGAAHTGVDIRTDIYSLGAVLYELLVGTTALDSDTLRSVPTAEMLRLIAEAERPRPSDRLHANEHSDRIAADRETTAASLDRALAHELDWIVMKAIESEPGRRYQSVRELDDDLRRYLEHEPVHARPPSLGYRLRKRLRRHRVLTAIAASLVLGVIGVVGGLAWALTTRAELATRNETLDRIVRHQKTRLREMNVAAIGVDLQKSVLESLRRGAEDPLRMAAPAELDPAVTAQVEAADFTSVGRGILVRHLFEPARKAIDRDFASDPIIRADLLHNLGETLYRLGLVKAASAPFETALELREVHRGRDHLDTLWTCNALGVLHRAGGRLAKSREFTERVLAGRRRQLGDQHLATLDALNNMGTLATYEGDFKAAEGYFQRALDGYRATVGSKHKSTLRTLSNLGTSHEQMHDLGAAEGAYREAMDGFIAIGAADDPTALSCAFNLGRVATELGNAAEGSELGRRAWEGLRRLKGAEHPQTLAAAESLGIALGMQGETERAETVLAQTLEIARRVLGDRNQRTLNCMTALAAVLRTRGELDDAESLCVEALRGYQATQPTHSFVGMILVEYGRTLAALGRDGPAERALARGHATLEQKLGEDHGFTREARDVLDAFRSGELTTAPNNAR